MKRNESETNPASTNQEEEVSRSINSTRCHQGIHMGIYGWRKKCLYALILVLLFMVIVNLALTLWVLKVMDFSSNGMGQLEIIPGGLRLKGNAFVLENLVASQIRSRRGEPIVVESSRNISLKSRNKRGYLSSYIHLGVDRFECSTNRFHILDDRGQAVFSADRNQVTVGTDSLRITGEGGTCFKGSVQTKLVRAETGHDLRLESSTRGLQIRAPRDLLLESRGGHVSTIALNDVSFKSEVGAIHLQSSSVMVPQLPTAKVTNRPMTARSFDVFQLCACESGKLFLASPHAVCASENEDGLCR
ncbi:zeta-sarcoglycan [Sitophilus oryzae]|uniref:Zeta-sarcoglycan n=1 Tax=Sitophilus oryzae TaxID=7048 RepID=A0A6J2YX48_SITOR|nr:zeta-sarcoglycan [Sitophilus oryzae]XP_030767820.1 zeta-sarcoglycan [Sitophilus oryzae]